jgi:AraC family transcriptional regulator, transcriptional activator of pobA
MERTSKSAVIRNPGNEINFFNVFRMEPFAGYNKRVLNHSRSYYRISLVVGNRKIIIDGRVIEVRRQALVFSNQEIPFSVEKATVIDFFCIFLKLFFDQYSDIDRYAVFQSGSRHVFELSDGQKEAVFAIYWNMIEEIDSGFIFKYDVLRTLVFELIHFALKW